MNILYEDRDIVICEKPAGVSSEEEGMPRMLREKLAVPEIYCVHRLDWETGGLMVYAKTKRAAASLSAAITAGKLEKTYLAVVPGAPGEGGVLKDLLFRDASRNKSYVVTRTRKGVREAELRYTRLASRQGWNLLRVDACRDCPLALWSAELRFPHPVTGEPLFRTLPPPVQWPWTLFSPEEQA